MSDFLRIEPAELLDAHLTMLLPDTIMMLSGESFRDMIPSKVAQRTSVYSDSIGYSRSEIEANPILALSPEEYKTLLLHMQGLKRGKIARILGITEVGVGMRLQKHRVKAAKARLLEEIDEDLSALVGEAVDVYRSGIKSTDAKIRLMAAKDILKANGRGEVKSTEANSSPAQFMSTLLKNIDAKINVNVGLNDYEQPTEKSLDGHVGRVVDAECIADSE